MALVSDIEIRLRADIARLQQDMNNARRTVSRSVDDIKGALKGMAAGFSLVAIATEVVRAQREFDKLNAALITATGSTKSAGEAFSALQRFAAQTPYDLAQVTDAFLQLRSLGLTPSERALTSFGNTAAAKSKDLKTVVEAVADAATGEFERLKEAFGITAKQAGDNVKFTFQGVTTTLRKNASEIEEYLTRIGEVQFGGGMARQAVTLDGAISNLNDTWQQTLVSFSQSGFGDGVMGSVKALSGALTDLGEIFKSVRGSVEEEGKAVEEIAPLHAALTTIFETITVLGVNVAYVFTQVGKEIGGLAAQAVAVAKGDFKAAGEISRMMREEAEADRKEVDAKTAAILGAAAKGKAAREQEAKDRAKNTEDVLAKYKIQSTASKQASDSEIKEAAKRAKAYKDFSEKVSESVLVTAREAAGLAPLNEAEKLEIELKQKLADKTLILTAAQEASVQARIKEIAANIEANKDREEYAKYIEDLAGQQKKLTDEREEAWQAARDEARANEELVATFGMTKSALEQRSLARLQDQLAQRETLNLTRDEVVQLQNLIMLKERSVEAVTQLDSLEKAKSFWTDIDQTARNTFISIADGGKGAAQRLKESFKNIFFDWLYKMTLQKWIINVGATISGTGAVAGIANGAEGVGGAGGGIGGVGGLIAGAKAAYSAVSLGFAGIADSVAAGVQGAMSAVGYTPLASQGLATASGQALTPFAEGAGVAAGYLAGGAVGIYGGRALSNGYAVSGSGNGLVNVGTVAGAILGGPIGAAVGGLIGGAANRLFGRKAREYSDRSNLSGNFEDGSFSGRVSTAWVEKGGTFRSDKTGVQRTAVDAVMASGLSAAYEAIKSSSADFAKVLGVNADSIASRSQALSLSLGKDEAENQKTISEFFTGVADNIARELLPNINDFSLAGEKASATFQRITLNFQVVEGVLTTLGKDSQTVFGAVGVASLKARERLVALSGGIEALAAQTTFFADNFLTKAEQIAPLQRQVNERLAELGYSSVTTAEQFKTAVLDLAQSGRLATDYGAEIYAGLMAIAPGFKTVSDYLAEIKSLNLENLRTRADDALDVLGNAVDAQKEIVAAAYEAVNSRLEAQLDGVNDKISEMTSLSQALRSSMGTVETSGQQAAARQAATAQIETAIAIAKAGGVLPSADDLRDALSTFGRDSYDQFSTLADYQRATARTNAQLEQLGGLTDDQLSTAERQLRLLQDQKDLARAANESELARLDGLVAYAQKQIDAANGISTSVLSLGGALQQVYTAVRDLKSATAQPGQVFGYEYREGKQDPGLPPFVYGNDQSGTLGGNDAALAVFNDIAKRLAAMESSNAETARATAQLASQFNTVSGGGNTLLVEPA